MAPYLDLAANFQSVDLDMVSAVVVDLVLTPFPRISIPGITFSFAILCSTRGVPYIAPRQDDILET